MKRLIMLSICLLFIGGCATSTIQTKAGEVECKGSASSLGMKGKGLTISACGATVGVEDADDALSKKLLDKLLN